MNILKRRGGGWNAKAVTIVPLGIFTFERAKGWKAVGMESEAKAWRQEKAEGIDESWPGIGARSKTRSSSASFGGRQIC